MRRTTKKPPKLQTTIKTVAIFPKWVKPVKLVRLSRRRDKFVPTPINDLGENNPIHRVVIRPCILKDDHVLNEHRMALGLLLRELIVHTSKRWWKTVDYFYDLLVERGWNHLRRRLTSVVNRQRRVVDWNPNHF